MNYEILKYDIIENNENIATFKNLNNVCLFISKYFEVNDIKYVNVVATVSHSMYGIVHITLRVTNTGEVIDLKEEDFTIDDEDEE
jgi:hypothetical protein